MSFYKILKPLGFHFHNLISKSKLFSRIYIDLLGDICHLLPNNSINKRILNSINSIQWTNFQLKHRTVQLGNSITFQLIPHLHEFDSEAIVTKYVNYEQEVFAYLERVKKQAIAQGYVQTILGRRRYFEFTNNTLRQLKGTNPEEIDLSKLKNLGYNHQ